MSECDSAKHSLFLRFLFWGPSHLFANKCYYFADRQLFNEFLKHPLLTRLAFATPAIRLREHKGNVSNEVTTV
jgi:hypothetical protein